MLLPSAGKFVRGHFYAWLHFPQTGDLSRVSHNLMLTTNAASQFNGGAVLTPGTVAVGQPAADARYMQPGQTPSQGHSQTLYPLSVESLRSSSMTHQVSGIMIFFTCVCVCV